MATKYPWESIIFDVLNLEDRAKYLATGATLPLTREASPLRHAEKVREFLNGEHCSDLYGWTAFARVEVSPNGLLADGVHEEIDSTTLESTYETMLLVEAHTSESSRLKSDRPSKSPPSKPKATAKRRK